jgi:hypothetical protein
MGDLECKLVLQRSDLQLENAKINQFANGDALTLYFCVLHNGSTCIKRDGIERQTDGHSVRRLNTVAA